MAQPPMTTIHGIQYLRALAALAVVLFHAAEKTGYHFAIGAAGVDVFFVISGFIMWVISDRRPVTPLAFLKERLRRIAPIYWLATLVMIGGGAAGLFPNLVLSVQHIVASLMFVPARSPSTGEIWPVLVQGWTLNFEMFFYVVFAASLMLPRHRRLPVMAALFVSLVLTGLVTDTQNALFLTYTRPVILEFVAGMIVAKFWLRGRVAGPGLGIVLVLGAFIGFAALAVLRLPFDERILGPLAVMLVVGTLALEAAGWFQKWALPTLLGDASYSIYLWHTFAISVVVKAAALIGLAPMLTLVVALVAGTLAGIAAYFLIERPLARRTRSRSPLNRVRHAS